MNKLNLSHAVTSTLNVPAPDGQQYMNFQCAGVEYLNACDRVALMCDPPGVGKTIQGIGYINYHKIKNVLIICPASLIYNWIRELNIWLVDKSLTIGIYHPKETFFEADILIMSDYWTSDKSMYVVRDITRHFKYDLCIDDEFHRFKTSNSIRTKMLFGKKGFLYNADMSILMSGTPIVSRPLELYPVLKAQTPHIIDNMTKFEFGMKYCGGFKAEYGYDFSGKSNLPALAKKMREDCMIRRRKELVLPQLSKKPIPKVLFMEQTARAKKLIKIEHAYTDEFIKTALNDFDSPEFDSMSTVRRELGVLKAPRVVD